MFRKIFFSQLSLLLLFSGHLALGAGGDSTGQLHEQKILIIPYEPRMHLSDADLDISDYSDRTPEQIRAMFRMGITEKLNAKLSTNYKTYSLLQDLRPEAIQQMDRIYAAIDYSFDTSYAILHPRPDSADSGGRWNETRGRKKELEKRSLSGEVKFMNVKILDPHLISSLNANYGADVFVFLTQVEIKTKAKDCMDFQSHIYQRDFKIHYSVFDKNGNQLYGDVASVTFPSGSDEIGDIMAQNFPALCEKIKATVAGK